MNNKLAIFMALFLMPLFAACNMNANTNGAGLQVRDAKANLTLPTETGSLYMTIENGSGQDDRLIGASVTGCGVIEFHTTEMDGDVMRMLPVAGGQIPVPAGETVELKQGGLHMMCLDKRGDFLVGDSVDIELEFANAGTVSVVATIVAPGGVEMDNE